MIQIVRLNFLLVCAPWLEVRSFRFRGILDYWNSVTECTRWKILVSSKFISIYRYVAGSRRRWRSMSRWLSEVNYYNYSTQIIAPFHNICVTCNRSLGSMPSHGRVSERAFGSTRNCNANSTVADTKFRFPIGARKPDFRCEIVWKSLQVCRKSFKCS